MSRIGPVDRLPSSGTSNAISSSMNTKREQVEAILRGRKYEEVTPSEWAKHDRISGDIRVRLDIAHSPDMLWICYMNSEVIKSKREMSYEEFIAIFAD